MLIRSAYRQLSDFALGVWALTTSTCLQDPAVGSVVTSRLGKLLREGFTVGGKQINLRLITAGEVGPEKFFFGSQTACILLAALFQVE